MTSKDVKLLNEALEIEYEAISVYEAAISTGLFSEEVAKTAHAFQSHHGHHASKLKEAIHKLGGEPVKILPKEEYIKKVPEDKLKSQEGLLSYALKLEKIATIAFLQQVPELDDRYLGQVAASISGDEAMHWSVLRHALGLNPVPVSFIPVSLDEPIEGE